MSTPTFNFQYNNTMQVYRRALSKKMEWRTWRYGKLAAFSGFVDGPHLYETAPNYAEDYNDKPTGKICDIRRDFESQGGLEMDIPLLSPLSSQGVYGGQQLVGNEETRKILTKKVSVNIVRNAVRIRDSKLSKQALKKPEIQMLLMRKGADDLTDWFGRKISYFMAQSVLEGFSDNLTTAVKLGGTGLSVNSHPNFFVAASGAATKVAFTAFGTTYESAVASAVAAQAQTSASYFTAAAVRDIAYNAAKQKIQGVEIVKGAHAPLVLIVPSQMKQLRADAEWQQAQRVGNVRGSDNPIFSGIGEGYLFEGCYLLVDATLPGLYVSGDSGFDGTAVASGSVQYGSYDSTSHLRNYMALQSDDVTSRKAALVLGKQAIIGGYAQPIEFESEVFDFNARMSDGADAILGFARSDITDDDGYFGAKGAFLENTSSMVYLTYSPV